MKIFFTIVITLALSMAAFAQAPDSGFPLPIEGGRTFEVPRGFDYVWLLTHSQYKEAVKQGRKLELADSINVLLELKNEKLQDVIAEKDSIITLSQRGYHHYRDLWQQTDRELEEAEIKAAKRWRFAVVGFMVGAGAAALTGAALAVIVD